MTVVVGTDGSDQAHAALLWAAEHASRTGARLRLVHAVVLPVMGGLAWRTEAVAQAERLVRAIDEDAHRELGRAAGLVRHRHPGLEVDTDCVHGDPREAVLAGTAAGDLVVVGSRGQGPVRSLLLGSVSAAVVRHAECPTVVHRTPATDAHGVAASDDPVALAFAEEYAAAHGLEVTPVAAHDVDALVEAAQGRQLLVVVRRHPATTVVRGFERAVAVAEHAGCPVAVVPAT
ncbi:universal stress protein [Nocardioides sp.]|uniref:universal stress protein n=1 Tax=Nocardioides sp. TaxID=35761 RepID=UPI0037850F0A